MTPPRADLGTTRQPSNTAHKTVNLVNDIISKLSKFKKKNLYRQTACPRQRATLTSGIQLQGKKLCHFSVATMETLVTMIPPRTSWTEPTTGEIKNSKVSEK